MASFKLITAALDPAKRTPEIYSQFRDRMVQLGKDFELARERYEMERKEDVENALRRLLGMENLYVLFFSKEGMLATPGSGQVCSKAHQACTCFKKQLIMRLRLEGGLVFQCLYRQTVRRMDHDSNKVVYLPEEADETWTIDPAFLDANKFDEETLKSEIRQVLGKYKRM